MFRAKTAKRGVRNTRPSAAADISGAVIVQSSTTVERNSNAVSTESMLNDLLNAESAAAVHRPWLRLERGLRMRLLRANVEKQKDLAAGEKVDLLAALIEALDRKLLNSKSQITYNQEAGDIIEINALKIIRPAEGKISFRIEPPNRGTKKAGRAHTDSD
jgi:hypothetical protein